MNFRKKYSIFLTFIAGIFIGLLLIAINKTFFSGSLLYSQATPTNSIQNIEDDNYFKYYKMFTDAYKIIKREFFDSKKTTAKNLLYGAIRGMLESLEDPYSIYMEPEFAKEFNTEMSGNFSGVGLQVDLRDGWPTVISPLEDTPAWKAGIKPGDKIIEVEGVSTKNTPISEIRDKLRGNPGTKVTITIAREGIKEPFKITITREVIKIKTVKTDIINTKNKKIGYIKLLEFTLPTAEDFKKELSTLLDKKIDGLIIDLRYNPGGLITSVVKIADYFHNEGLIVYTRGKTEENNSEFYASQEDTFVPLNLPLVVLVNEGSASASEIFTGSIKDTGRGVIVGTKTFGKGSVQKTFQFQEDGSMIKYTVARYFTPSGKCIDKEGIEPDITETMWFDKLNEEEKKAIININNTNIISEFVKKNKEITEEKKKDFIINLEKQGYKISRITLDYMLWMKKIENNLPPVYNLEFDNQLSKAVEVLENYNKYKKNYKIYKEPK